MTDPVTRDAAAAAAQLSAIGAMLRGLERDTRQLVAEGRRAGP